MSWQGAYIADMVSAWPHPNETCRGVESTGEAGCVQWEHNQGRGDRGTAAYNYRCSATAYFDAAGLITRVEVTESLHCHRRFERHFERMTRTVSPDLESEVEEPAL